MITERNIRKLIDAKILLIILALVLPLLSGCSVVRGSGRVVTESRAVSGFDRVSLSDQGEIILVQGERESLEIEAEDNILSAIETEVRGGTLHIGARNNTALNPTEPIRYYLTMKDIKGFEISGSGDITAESINSPELIFEISGSGDIRIGELAADSLRVEISGSGDVEAAGQVESQDIEISGSGKYRAADLESEAVDVAVSGTGEVTVWAREILDIRISGSGDVLYYGSPSVDQNISGSGEVRSLGSP